MLTDGQQVSIPAGSVVNVFLGRPIEFLGKDSVIRLLLAADAAGLTASMTVNQGGSQIAPLADGTPVNFPGIIGTGPKDDEDTMIAAQTIPAGSRSALNITNTTGNAVNVRYRAMIAP